MAQLFWSQEIVIRNVLLWWFYTLEMPVVTLVVYPISSEGSWLLDMIEQQNSLDIKYI